MSGQTIARLMLGLMCMHGAALKAAVLFEDEFLGSGGLPAGWVVQSVFGTPVPTITEGSGALQLDSPFGTFSIGYLQSTSVFGIGSQTTVSGKWFQFGGYSNSGGMGVGLGEYATNRVVVGIGSPPGQVSIGTRKAGVNNSYVVTTIAYGGGALELTATASASGIRVLTSTGYDSGVLPWATVSPTAGFQYSDLGSSTRATITYGFPEGGYASLDRITVSSGAPAVVTGPFVSNLAQNYDFSAGLGGVYTQASSFTMAAASRPLGALAVSLQANSAGTASVRIVQDAGGLPGTLVEDLGSLPVSAGLNDRLFPASGAVMLQANTKYWVLVDAVGSLSWASTLSTAETSTGGETIGNDMYYRPTGGGAWTPLQTGPAFPTDTGRIAVYAYEDSDADGFMDVLDNCPAVGDPDQSDTDGDGRGNVCDNCRTVQNNSGSAAQCDSDGDSFGNRCDGDLNNNNATNAQDSVLFRVQLGQPSLAPTYNAADLNCSGAVNAQDTVLLRSLLGSPPGPGAGP